jgi:phage baseplate assembly protein W
LGTDLFLSTNKLNLSDNSGGDLNIDTEGDYQLVSGIDCLIQDTSHRLMTELGSHPYHDNYGSELSFFVGNVSDDTWNIKASLEVQRTLKCDPRITDVGDVNIFSSGIIKYLDYNVEVDDVSYNAREVLMNEEI